jgi:hypothetical protein
MSVSHVPLRSHSLKTSVLMTPCDVNDDFFMCSFMQQAIMNSHQGMFPDSSVCSDPCPVQGQVTGLEPLLTLPIPACLNSLTTSIS